MPLRDVLKKRNIIRESSTKQQKHEPKNQPFTFLRTSSTSQEIIHPPSFPDDPPEGIPRSDRAAPEPLRPEKHREKENSSDTTSNWRSIHVLRKHSGASSVTSSEEQYGASTPPGQASKSERRLSAAFDKLHIGRSSRSSSGNSVHVPADLPNIEGSGTEAMITEAEWERRAALLARQNELATSQSGQVPSITLSGASDDTGQLRSDGEAAAGKGKEKAAVIEDDVRVTASISRTHSLTNGVS